MPARALLILLTAALASGAQATAERAGWAHAANAESRSIDGTPRVGFHPAAQAGAGAKGDYP